MAEELPSLNKEKQKSKKIIISKSQVHRKQMNSSAVKIAINNTFEKSRRIILKSIDDNTQDNQE